MSENLRWIVRPYGFDDHVVEAPTKGAARYRDFRAAREAGYFGGRDGFWRYLVNGVSVEPSPPPPTPRAALTSPARS